MGAAEPDRGGGGGSVPPKQVRPGVPQALPRQRDRYVSFTVGEFNFQFYFESIAARFLLPGCGRLGLAFGC